MSSNLIIVERNRADTHRRYLVSAQLCLQPYCSGGLIVTEGQGGAYELWCDLRAIEGVRHAGVDLMWVDIDLEPGYADMPKVHLQVLNCIKQLLGWEECKVVVREPFNASYFSRKLLEIMSRQTRHPLGLLDLIQPLAGDPVLDDLVTDRRIATTHDDRARRFQREVAENRATGSWALDPGLVSPQHGYTRTWPEEAHDVLPDGRY